MRLITHNMLQCHAKGCNANNFPLRFSDVEVEMVETEYNAEFMANIVSKLEWPALVHTAAELGNTSLPSTIPENYQENEEFLQTLHTVILETHVKDGKMICPNCGHVYPIKDGIPNMLLAEHEV